MSIAGRIEFLMTTAISCSRGKLKEKKMSEKKKRKIKSKLNSF